MKYLNTIFLIVVTLTCCNIGYIRAEEQHKIHRIEEIENVLLNNINNSRITDSEPIVFLVGESNRQRELRLERERAEEIKRADLSRASNTSYGRGYVSQDGNPYPYGWCTWYVAEKAEVTTSYGNARNWPVNSTEPKVGGIVVTYESRYGHVAYIEAVNGDDITLSEMNYKWWGKANTRIINKNNKVIKGFLI